METEVYKKVKLKDNKELNIVYDKNPESPREWDNLGTMAIFHRRYNFGDSVDFSSDDFNSWSEMEEHITKDLDAAVILPIYMYDHSGITINTTGFNCSWDSGQVGFIYVTKQKVREDYSVKRITKDIIEKATTILEDEVKTMDQYLTGEVYGYELYKIDVCNQGHEHKEFLDSCYGYYGDPDYIISEFKNEMIDTL